MVVVMQQVSVRQRREAPRCQKVSEGDDDDAIWGRKLERDIVEAVDRVQSTRIEHDECPFPCWEIVSQPHEQVPVAGTEPVAEWALQCPVQIDSADLQDDQRGERYGCGVAKRQLPRRLDCATPPTDHAP